MEKKKTQQPRLDEAQPKEEATPQEEVRIVDRFVALLREDLKDYIAKYEKVPVVFL